ncbi:hypothetical protein IFM89_002141 [Coptis chinensis]|uniref:COP1-interacting protein 7 n=1 Tax=Coptis chinensis TaxID=261450 RepID=A0A835GWY8_9MAGN|nr:hypothetical protein IFM89_002141 [Coptis chinensis]
MNQALTILETERSVDVRDEYFSIQSSESGRPYATSHAVEVESEQRTKQRMAATDFFVVTNRDEVDEGGTHLKNFEGENFYSSMKKRDCTDEELLFSQKNDDAIRDVQDTFSDCNNGSSLVKTQRGEDWFIVNQPEKSVGTYATRQSSVFSENSNVIQGNSYLQSERKSRNALVDDSFMIQDRPLAVDQPESQWRTDISMVSGLTVAPQREDSILDPLGDKSGMSGNYEPDDLYMVLDRGSGVVPAAAWATEMDYGMDMSFTEADKQHSGTKTDDCSADQPTDGTTTEIKSNGVSETKHSGQDTQSKPLRGSLGKSKTEIISRNKKPPTMSRVTMHKSKFETEEETRKRMEQLVIERQKRIAERSAARGSTPAASKKVPVESKKVANYVKDDKQTSHSATQVTRKLSLQKSGSVSSAVSRLTSSTASLKSTESKKTSSKVNGEVSGTLSPNTVREDNKKSKLNEAKSSKKLNVVTSPLSEVKDKDQTARSKVEVKVELLASQLPMDGVDISEDKKQHKGPSAITMAEQDSIVDVNKIYSEGPTAIRESSFPVCENYGKLDPSQLGNGDVYIATPILHVEKTIGHTSQINGVTTESRVDSLPAETKYALKLDEVLRTENERSLVSTEISEEEMTPNWNESTPPSISELSLDQTHSRRKWTSEESSPTTAKGFKKLLMFGRKKAQVAT